MSASNKLSSCLEDSVAFHTQDASAAGDVPRYTGTMQAMHWITATQLFCAYLAAWMIDSAANPAQGARLVMLHRSFGVTILLLATIRIVIRRRSRIPPLPPSLPTIQRLAARANALLLYGLLIVQPLLGLISSMLHGDRIVLFGSSALPSWLPPDKSLAHRIFQLHGWTALTLLALIGMHIAAALYHHFVRRDAVLAGMLPGVRPLTIPANIRP